jgi:phage-related protein
LWGFLKQLSKRLGLNDFFKAAIIGLKDIFNGVQKLIPSFQDVIFYVKGMAIYISAFGAMFAETFISAGEIIGNFIIVVYSNMTSMFQWILDNGKLVIVSLWKIIKAFVSDIILAFSDAFKLIKSILTGHGGSFSGFFKGLGGNLKKALGDIKLPPLKLIDPLKSSADKYKEYQKRIEEINKSMVKSINKLINSEFKSPVKDIAEKIKKEVDKAKSLVSGLQGSLSTAQPYTEATFADTVEAQKAQFGISSTDKNIEKNTFATAKAVKENAKSTEKLANAYLQPPVYKMA